MDFKDIEKTVRNPEVNAEVVSNLDIADEFKGPVWVYKYFHKKNNWLLSIATHGEPNSNKLSLGGFRIVPTERASLSTFNNDNEAIGLCVGMEEKVFWSKLIKVGGPLGLKNLSRIVGGKCVLLPSSGSRVGEPRDQELLDFGLACLSDFEKSSGVLLTTGQDLGHGTMADASTSSITYMSERFNGFIASDTSKPTAEGNFMLLRGALSGLGISLDRAQIGLIGIGNIGQHVLNRLRESKANVFALESNPQKVQALREADIQVWAPEQKMEFLALPMDALIVNANGGSLDQAAITAICENSSIEFICGSENLAMPVAHGAQALGAARKIYCPTELCGMMGYLTAVEDYLNRCAKTPFVSKDMFMPAMKLEEVGLKATELALKSNFNVLFEEAVRKIY